MSCSCHQLGRLGALPVTVNQGSPCAQQYIKAFGAQSGTHSIIDELAYYLCEAETKLTSWGVSAWHWTWTELENLWDWLGKVTREGIQDLRNAINKFFRCLNCIDPTASAADKKNCSDCPKLGATEWWVWLGIAGFVLYEFRPAINDSVHYYTRRARG